MEYMFTKLYILSAYLGSLVSSVKAEKVLNEIILASHPRKESTMY